MEIEPEDQELAIPGHQVHLTRSTSSITIIITAENGAEKEYTVNIARESGGRTPIKDFDLSEF